MGAMAAPRPPGSDSSRVEPAPPRRAYDSTARRRQAAETRRRIVLAATELVHTGPARVWQGVTVRAVAARAGVSERTLYRHFGSERGLRDAVMHHLEEEAGIDLVGMTLEDVAEIAARIFEQLASFPLEPRPPLDPTLREANQRQRRALLAAVAARTEPRWSEKDQTAAAAVFDVLWSSAAYERLVVDWKLDQERAAEAVAWTIGLVADAVRGGHPPARR